MATVDLFASTSRPDEGLFYTRNDPNDIRMGESIVRPRKHSRNEVVIVGCPQDEGVARNQGRGRARSRRTEIRRAFYRSRKPPALDAIRIFDLGDVIPKTTLEATHAGTMRSSASCSRKARS